VEAELFLDFKNERLIMGPEGKVQIKDNGTPTTIQHVIDYMRFRKCYYLNGELEVYDADHETLLGRCDPFIPLNIMPVETAKLIDEAIVGLEKEAQRREQASVSNEEKEQAQPVAKGVLSLEALQPGDPVAEKK
jgi:hypothetical protein